MKNQGFLAKAQTQKMYAASTVWEATVQEIIQHCDRASERAIKISTKIKIAKEARKEK